MAGHSFGAATVVEVLRNTDRFKNVQAGIIYDIWGAPIKPPEDDPAHRIHLPLLGINSEAFMYWQANFDAAMSLMKEAKEQEAPAVLCTVRGSVHINQSDFSVLYSNITSFFFKATVHPQRAIDLNISASLEFLREVTSGAGKSIIMRCLTDEELLKTQPLEQMPNDHKPNDEWIAARLKIKHEFRTRLASGIQRKMKRQLKNGSHSPGDEVWMHVRPNKEEMKNWRMKSNCDFDDYEDNTIETGDSDTAVEQDGRDTSERDTGVDGGSEEDENRVAPADTGDALMAGTQDTWLGMLPALQKEQSSSEESSSEQCPSISRR